MKTDHCLEKTIRKYTKPCNNILKNGVSSIGIECREEKKKERIQHKN